MLDVPMPQLLLQGTCIDPFIRQVKSARMPQHGGVDGNRQPHGDPSLGHEMMHRTCGERPPMFGDKEIGHARKVV
jgi:hypothetical protein